MSVNHPEIIELSRLLGELPYHPVRENPDRFRNPNGVLMHLMNVRYLDTGHGLRHPSRVITEVFHKYRHRKDELRELAEAIRRLANDVDIGALLRNVLDEEESGAEGGILFIMHKVHERNRRLVRLRKAQALREHGVLECEACGLVPSAVYGKFGDSVIECHHTRPLSQMGGAGRTYLRDLALVCANCHRILHGTEGYMTVETLRAMLGTPSFSRS